MSYGLVMISFWKMMTQGIDCELCKMNCSQHMPFQENVTNDGALHETPIFPDCYLMAMQR